MRKLVILVVFLLAAIFARAQDYASSDFSRKVIGSFTQGDDYHYNRAAISLIKCAIATFGSDAVTGRIEPRRSGLHISLRNGDTLYLSNAELYYCKTHCGFRLMSQEKVFDKAVLLYAILAKRSDSRNLPRAVRFLEGRSRPVDVIALVELLGLDYIPVRACSEICYIHQGAAGAMFSSYYLFDEHGICEARKIPVQHAGINIILANFIR